MCLHFGYNVISNENTIKILIVLPTMTVSLVLCTMTRPLMENALPMGTSKLHLHYFLKDIVSETFMTSLTW